MGRRFLSCGWGLGLVAEGWLVHLQACHGQFLEPGQAERFTACGIAAGLAFVLAAFCFERADLTARQTTWLFWVGAVVLRFVIAAVPPGDDLWRYRWEGAIQLHGFSPYLLSPDAPVLASLRDADWSKINHRDYPAIYPPLAQAFFAIMARFGNAVWLYKLVFSLADLAGCAVLRRLLRRAGWPAAQAVWYAWNPLVIYVFAGAAHFDCLMILSLLGALWALDAYRRGRASLDRPGHPEERTALLWLSAFLLGVAIAIKMVPLVLVPIFLVAAASWRKVPGLMLLMAAPLAASAVLYGFPGTPVFATLQRFGREFRVNDPVWWAVDLATGSRLPRDNRLIGAVTLLACLLLTYLWRRDWRRGVLWVWGAALLLSPVVHAWYVVWVLPVAVWRGAQARPWVVLSISVFGYFLLWEINHASKRPWVEPLWLRLLIYLPPAAAVAWTTRRSGANASRVPPVP